MKIFFTSILIVVMILAIEGYKQPAAHALQEDQENAAIIDFHDNPDTADIEAIAKEVRKEKLLLNPLTRRMVEATAKEDPIEKATHSMKEGLLTLLLTIRNYKVVLIIFSFLAAVGVLALFAARNTSLSKAGVACARYGFAVGRILVIALAPLAVAAWFTFRYNFFAGMGVVFILGLLALLLSSAVSLHFQQDEDHIWNSLLFSVIWPTASGVIIHFL